MDATQARRARDRAWKVWYARHRQWRFARHLGLVGAAPAPHAVAGIVGRPGSVGAVRIFAHDTPQPGPIAPWSPACDRSNDFKAIGEHP